VRRGLEVLHTPGVAPDYLALVDERVRPVERADAHAVVLVAARVGRTRLLDNVALGEGVAQDPVVGGA
jgi:pantothenate synthetase